MFFFLSMGEHSFNLERLIEFQIKKAILALHLQVLF